jgi:uncharacterized protein (DUF433 family)
MPAINRGQQTTNVGAVDLNRMVGMDPHRPGPARARLLVEQIPVWAIVGHVASVARTTDPVTVTGEVIARVAADFDIRSEAVEAALLYYQEHRGAIDALLQANAAAIT